MVRYIQNEPNHRMCFRLHFTTKMQLIIISGIHAANMCANTIFQSFGNTFYWPKTWELNLGNCLVKDGVKIALGPIYVYSIRGFPSLSRRMFEFDSWEIVG